LLKERYLSSCGLLQDKDGQAVVAIVGGADEDGSMETWNPLTSEIKLLWEHIPNLAEIYHYWAQLLPINQGTGFFLYGGKKGYDITSDEIWKYTVQNNSWER